MDPKIAPPAAVLGCSTGLQLRSLVQVWRSTTFTQKLNTKLNPSVKADSRNPILDMCGIAIYHHVPSVLTRVLSAESTLNMSLPANGCYHVCTVFV